MSAISDGATFRSNITTTTGHAGIYPSSVVSEVADDVPTVRHVGQHAGGRPGVVARVRQDAAVCADDVADLAADLVAGIIAQLHMEHAV